MTALQQMPGLHDFWPDGRRRALPPRLREVGRDGIERIRPATLPCSPFRQAGHSTTQNLESLEIGDRQFCAGHPEQGTGRQGMYRELYPGLTRTLPNMRGAGVQSTENQRIRPGIAECGGGVCALDPVIETDNERQGG
ncbi:Uncharacterised protein [Mycobacteroides abscessus subsp. abscessus]|nr:Uncharacterised protein [Mycobacteroides abscessus subsp. abscessus]